MATNKDKLLESAQKNLKKKQIAKAIKDYAKIVEIDPADVRSRQKLAELYVRTNKNTEAYEHFEAVAKYFSSNGFYSKAIAIYKQMQRLDPSQVSIINRLAELNEKQGLIGDAMAEYRKLVDYFGRNGMVADEIKVLEKMSELDQDNLNVRIKLAEVLATNDRKDEGLDELESVLKIFSERGDFDKILKLYKMFLPHYPNNKKLQTGLALAFFEKGDYSRGVIIVESLLKDKPDDPDLLRLVAKGYAEKQDWAKALEYNRKLHELDPTDLDVRQAIIQVEFGAGQYERVLPLLEEWKESFLKADKLQLLKGYYETLKEQLDNNRVVLETLDSIYELTGEADKLLDIISVVEHVPEDDTDSQDISDSLLGSVHDDISGDELDLELTQDDLLSSSVVEEEEIDLELESLDTGLSFDDQVGEESEAEAVIELHGGDDLDLGGDVDSDDSFFFSFSEDDQDAGPQQGKASDLKADLEEAEFYLQQGLYDEAEKLCEAIQDYAPDNQECQSKLAEIRKQRAGMSSSAQGAKAPEPEDPFAGDFGDFDFTISDTQNETPDDSAKVFRTDVDEQIAADDMESHYNLGIAYREMGLLDDAISEFEKAERAPGRYVDCQMLKGLSYADKEDYANAEIMFQQALDSPYLEDLQRMNLCYELGLLYERSDRINDALISYQDVLAQDANYRDVRDKVTALKASLGLTETASDVEESKERISFL